MKTIFQVTPALENALLEYKTSGPDHAALDPKFVTNEPDREADEHLFTHVAFCGDNSPIKLLVTDQDKFYASLNDNLWKYNIHENLDDENTLMKLCISAIFTSSEYDDETSRLYDESLPLKIINKCNSIINELYEENELNTVCFLFERKSAIITKNGEKYDEFSIIYQYLYVNNSMSFKILTRLQKRFTCIDIPITWPLYGSVHIMDEIDQSQTIKIYENGKIGHKREYFNRYTNLVQFFSVLGDYETPYKGYEKKIPIGKPNSIIKKVWPCVRELMDNYLDLTGTHNPESYDSWSKMIWKIASFVKNTVYEDEGIEYLINFSRKSTVDNHQSLSDSELESQIRDLFENYDENFVYTLEQFESECGIKSMSKKSEEYVKKFPWRTIVIEPPMKYKKLVTTPSTLIDNQPVKVIPSTQINMKDAKYDTWSSRTLQDLCIFCSENNIPYTYVIDYMKRHVSLINGGQVYVCETMMKYEDKNLKNELSCGPALEYKEGENTIKIPNMFNIFKTRILPVLRRYDQIVFNPDIENCPQTHYNLYKGNPNAKISLIAYDKQVEIDYINFITRICNGDNNVVQYILKSMAHKVQRPWEKTGKAFLFYSETEGIGKNLMVNIFAKVLGEEYCTLDIGDLDKLDAKFNSHMATKLLISCNEIKASRKVDADVLKNLITADKIIMEKKYQDGIQINDYRMYIFTTNNYHSLTVGKTCRRMVMIMCTNDVLPQNLIDKYVKILKSEQAIRTLYEYFSKMDISDFRPNDIPKTKYKDDQKMMMLPWYIKFILDPHTDVYYDENDKTNSSIPDDYYFTSKQLYQKALWWLSNNKLNNIPTSDSQFEREFRTVFFNFYVRSETKRGYIFSLSKINEYSHLWINDECPDELTPHNKMRYIVQHHYCT